MTAPMASRVAWSRPSEKLGTASSTAAGVLPGTPAAGCSGHGASGADEDDRVHPLTDAVRDRRCPLVGHDPGRAGAHVREQARCALDGCRDGTVLLDREGRGDDAVDLADDDLAARPVLRRGPAEADQLRDVFDAGVADDEGGGREHEGAPGEEGGVAL